MAETADVEDGAVGNSTRGPASSSTAIAPEVDAVDRAAPDAVDRTNDGGNGDSGARGAAVGGTAGSSRRVDPLLLLRNCTKAKRKVQYVDEYLDIDGRRIHRSAKCGFRLMPPKGPLIDIGSVWYMLHEISGGGSYTQDLAKKRGFTYIGVACRSDLVDYLVGRAEGCVGLEMDVIEGRKRPKADREGLEPRGKRSKADAGIDGEEEALYSASGAQISYSDVLSRVRPIQDLDVLVRSPGRTVPNADLILRIAQEELSSFGKERRRPETQNSGKVPLSVELEEILRKDEHALPIILVPCNKNAPLNLLNAHDFLQYGDFRKPDEERTRFFESTRPEAVQVSRTINGKVWTFEVRDNAVKFTKAQWKRTVCVVCDGSDWQFKGWPFETTVDLFATIRGVFIQAANTMVPVHVNQWQVQILRMSASHLGHRYGHLRDAFFNQLEVSMDSLRLKKFANNTSFDAEKRIIEKPKPVL